MERRIKLPNDKAYDRASARGRESGYSLFSEKHCCVCGKEIKFRAWTDWLLLSRADDGSFEFAILHPNDATAKEREAGLWVAPIGPDCLRRHPELAPFVLPGER